MKSNNISEKIKELREEKGLTQNELAKDLFIKQQTVAQWEKGERAIKADTVILLSQYFNVTSDYLLGLSEYKTPQAADIGAATGLSDTAIKELHELKNGSYVLSYLLSKIIESGDFYEFLLKIDKYVWHELTNTVWEKLLLEEFIKENKLNISPLKIAERGIYALDEEQEFKFSSFKRDNSHYKENNTDYDLYLMEKSLATAVSDFLFTMFDDNVYNTDEITDYTSYYPSPWIKEQFLKAEDNGE